MQVRRYNRGARRGRSERPAHRHRHPFRPVQSQRGNGRPASAQKCAQRAGSLGCRNNLLKIRNQPRAKRLVQTVRKIPAQRFVILTNECGGDGAGIPATFDRGHPIDFPGQNFSSFARLHLMFGYQQNEFEPRKHVELLHCIAPRNRKSTETGGSGVIRMAFQRRGKFEELVTIKRMAGKMIESEQKAYPNGGATAQASRSRHVFPNRTAEGEPASAASFEEKAGRLVQHCRQSLLFCRALDRHHIIKAERNPETIEPRAKVRDACWNTNSNPVHC